MKKGVDWGESIGTRLISTLEGGYVLQVLQKWGEKNV